jgi:hypothetical protein
MKHTHISKNSWMMICNQSTTEGNHIYAEN